MVLDKRFWGIFKAILIIPIIFYIGKDISFIQIFDALIKSNLALVLFAFLIYILRYIIQGLRWYNASLAHSNSVKNGHFYIRAQLEIAFLEMVFPVPDSEDALRIMKLRHFLSDTGMCMTIILFDRMIGLLFLITIVPFSFLFLNKQFIESIHSNPLLIGIIGTVLFSATLFYRYIIIVIIQTAQKWFSFNWIFLENLKNSIQLKTDIRYRIIGLFLVVGFGMASSFCIWALTLSFGITIPFLTLFLSIPFLYISQTFPISYQGLGIYEATIAFILQQNGVDKSFAIAIGSIHFFFHVIIIAIGGCFVFTNPMKDFISTNSISNQ